MADQTGGSGLVKRWLDGRAMERLPIVVHLGPYAARLQQISYRGMCEDPTVLANALQGASRLFECDGLIVLADSTIEAEACGCEIEWRDDEPVVVTHPLAGDQELSTGLALWEIEGRGRLAVLLEATERLGKVLGRDTAPIPAVAGPVTLATHLRGPAFWADLSNSTEMAYRALELGGQVTLLVARRYLDLGFEQLVILDPALGRVDPVHGAAVGSALRPLGNIAEFYDARLLLQTEIDDPTSLEALMAIGADGLLVEGDPELDLVAHGARRPETPLGVAVPSPLFGAGHGHSDIEEGFAAWKTKTCRSHDLPVCLKVPRSTPPENLQLVLRSLRG